MTIDWNPNHPTIKGMEHRDVAQGQRVVGNSFDMLALEFEGRHTGGVDRVDFYMGGGVDFNNMDGRFNSLRQPFMAELYNAGSEPTGLVQQDTFAPSALTTSGGTTITDQGGGAAAASDLTSPDDGSYLIGRVLNSYVDLSFDTAAFPLDRRIMRIGLRVDTNSTFRITRLDPVSTGFYWYKDIPAATLDPRPIYAHWGEAKVDRGASEWSWWTPQDIRDMRSGGTRKWRIQCRAGAGRWVLDYVRLYIIWVPENRLGVGIGESATSSYSWVSANLKTPAGTGMPSLVNGNDYSLILRRSVAYSMDDIHTLTMPWRYMQGRPIDTDDWKAKPVLQQVPPDAANSLFLGGSLQTLGLGEQVDGIYTARFASGGVIQPEAQPYALSRAAKVFGINNLTSTTGSPAGGVIAQQYLNVTASDVYGQLFMVVGRGNILPTGPLRVDVWDDDGIQVFSTVELTVDQWNDIPISTQFPIGDQQETYKVVRFRFPESLSLPAGQYRVRISAPEAHESRLWYIGALIANVHTTNQTMGGATTEHAEGYFNSSVSPFTSLNDATFNSELQVVLATVPPPVTGVAGAVGVRTAHHAQAPPGHSCSESGCADQGSPFAQVSWQPTSDTESTFYQIQRQDQVDTDWRFVAQIRGRNVTRWEDEEVRIGVQSCYRIRSGRPDGILGDWSETICVTPPPGQVALTFTSNYATGAAVTLPEAWEGSQTIERTWEHNEYGDVQLRPIYGSNGQRAFHPVEKRGVSFARTLLLNALRGVAPPSLEITTPLHRIAWAPLPYVCVRDGEGNRFFASIQVPQTVNRRRGERWYAEVIITVATDQPAIIDTAEDQVDV